MQNEKENKMVTNWLNKHGNIEIDKQVEIEEEHIKISIFIEEQIKKYCKYMGIKFVKYCENGFIGCYKFKIRAGIEYTTHNGKIISYPIRTIRHKTIYRKYLCYKDGDIIDDGIYNNIQTR